MPRVPLLAGSSITVVQAPDDAIVLRPPPPGEAIADVGAAVRDALRFPLAGEALETLAPRGGRVTVVVEPPVLPLPGSEQDPRENAIAAVVDELERLGVPSGYQTILVAGGLARRSSQRDIAQLVRPEFARRFHGRVEVHDAESEELVELEVGTDRPLRVNRFLVETDLVIVVSAAETVLHGGPATLLAAASAGAIRAAGAYSLLETAASQGWRLSVAVENALARRVPVIGASLVLNHPRLSGWLLGYPYEPAALDRIASSPLRRAYGTLPAWARGRVLRSIPRDLTAAAAYAGPPSVAHAEALLRGVELRGANLDAPLDALVIGVARKELKRRQESADAYTGAGRADAARREQAAAAILKPYLPAQMDPAELEAELRKIIEELKPSGPAGFGMVMKEASQRLSGRAAGSEIAAAAKRLLG